MNRKEIVREFRASSWPSTEAVADFIARARGIDVAGGQELLAVLLDRKLIAEGRTHGLRCIVFGRILAAQPDREMFLPLVRAARAADPLLLRTLGDLLPRVNHVGSHPELVQLFRSPSPEVRALAREVTVKVGGKTAFGLLQDMVAEPEMPGRMDAIETLVSLAGHHAVPALRRAFPLGRREEKLRMIELLGDPEVVTKHVEWAASTLRDAFRDEDVQVARAAMVSYANVGDVETFVDAVRPLVVDARPAFVLLVVDACRRFPDPRVIDLLRELFLLGPRNVRFGVLETFRVMNHEIVLPVVVEALEHRHLPVRMKAAEVLQSLGANGAVDLTRTILWLLRSRDVEIKRIAADVARQIVDPEGRTWPLLLRYLRDEDWWVRERVTDALVEMAGTQLTRHVALYMQDESDVVRRFGVEMLMRLEDPASLGLLVRSATTDSDWWVRERAIEAMGRIGDARAVPYVIDLMQKEPELRLVCFSALARLHDPAASAPIAEYLEDPEPHVVLEVLHALEALGDASVAPQLVRVANHPDPKVRARVEELASYWRVDVRGGHTMALGASSDSPLEQLLLAMEEQRGDDLLLAPGRPAFLKKHGEMVPLGRAPLTQEEVEAMLLPILTPVQREAVARREDVDLSHAVRSRGLRFRVNVFWAHNGLSAVLRIIRNDIPELESLGLPPIIHTFGDLPHGLVLVGGPTGSGKSTTLAALIDYINRTYARHIITLEDPIEVVHTPRRALINQREIGTHTASFHNALRATMREDPDVILVGEMRDLETIKFAISAAETGHLVFGTVHTNSADSTVDRLINAFPAAQQPQVRSILASSLQAVCCQFLAPRKDGKGRVPAVEVMLNTDAIANLIRKEKTFQIPNIIQMSRELGMRSMDHELVRLCREGLISADVAYARATNKKELEAALANAGIDVGGGPEDVGVPGTPAAAASLRSPAPSGSVAGVSGAHAAARTAAARDPSTESGFALLRGGNGGR